MQINKIFKIRMYINSKIKSGPNKGHINKVIEREEIVVNNLDYAREVYDSYLNQFSISSYCGEKI